LSVDEVERVDLAPADILVQVALTSRGRQHQSALSEARSREMTEREALDQAAQRLAYRQRNWASARAAVRELEEHPPSAPANPDDVRAELTFIRSLPGYQGMRVDADYGALVVRFHTAALYQNRAYDMGDYEVHIGRSDGLMPYMTCVRCTLLHGTSSAYWSATRREGYGTFCFGGRGSHIRKLYAAGEYGMMLHLIMNSMNHFNTGSWMYIHEYFPSTRTSKKRREAWKLGRSPDDGGITDKTAGPTW
jgi:hypothetical protein